MIEVGSFVRYKVSDDEPPVPALVQTVWEDGAGYELYVFHFTSQSHVRSAHPSQVEEVGSNADLNTRIDELNEDLAAAVARITEIEEENEMIKAELSSLSGDKQPGLPENVPSPVVENAGVDSTPQDQPSSNEQTEEPELVGTGKGKTARRRSAWPNE